MFAVGSDMLWSAGSAKTILSVLVLVSCFSFRMKVTKIVVLGLILWMCAIVRADDDYDCWPECAPLDKIPVDVPDQDCPACPVVDVVSE